jgi:hypothetical protein
MELIERLRQMAPMSGKTIVCRDRTTRQMNADIRQAADRLAAMKAAGDGLERFLEHEPDCPATNWSHEAECSCGLTDAIQKWKDVSHDNQI